MVLVNRLAQDGHRGGQRQQIERQETFGRSREAGRRVRRSTPRLMTDQTIAHIFTRSGSDQKARQTSAPSNGMPANSHGMNACPSS